MVKSFIDGDGGFISSVIVVEEETLEEVEFKKFISVELTSPEEVGEVEEFFSIKEGVKNCQNKSSLF